MNTSPQTLETTISFSEPLRICVKNGRGGAPHPELKRLINEIKAALDTMSASLISAGEMPPSDTFSAVFGNGENPLSISRRISGRLDPKNLSPVNQAAIAFENMTRAVESQYRETFEGSHGLTISLSEQITQTGLAEVRMCIDPKNKNGESRLSGKGKLELCVVLPKTRTNGDTDMQVYPFHKLTSEVAHMQKLYPVGLPENGFGRARNAPMELISNPRLFALLKPDTPRGSGAGQLSYGEKPMNHILQETTVLQNEATATSVRVLNKERFLEYWATLDPEMNRYCRSADPRFTSPYAHGYYVFSELEPRPKRDLLAVLKNRIHHQQTAECDQHND